jgi:uncharacterized repeat protein (TIGR01451 family)
MPYLRINKWGDGDPTAGSTFVFNVEYWNDGGAPAENSVITDTMLGGMTYVTDTSPFTHTGSGSGPIVWHLGTLAAHTSGQFEVRVHVTAVPPQTITNKVQIATSNPDDQGEQWEKESEWSGHVERPNIQMRVCYDRDEVGGNYPVGHTFWITLTDRVGIVKATAVTTSEIGGGQFMWDGFSVWGPKWSPQNADLEPGDWVYFQSDDGYDTEVRIGSIRAHLDIENDIVSGILYAPWFTQTLQGMVRNFHWWGMGGLDFTAKPDGGFFEVDVAPHDIVSDTRLTLKYAEPDNDWVIRDFDAYAPSALGFRLGVNYGDDWVNGHCEAGHTVWITATESDGVTIKATAVVTTDAEGFFVQDWDWSPSQPDIEPSDWVYGQADNGETRTVHVGTITGRPNAANDSIQGTVDVEWLEDVVMVTCGGWSGAPDGVPRKEVFALPDGADLYTCSWDPNTEWDVQPDQVIGVWYKEPDGDSVWDGDTVFNSFRVEQVQVFLPLVLRDY